MSPRVVTTQADLQEAAAGLLAERRGSSLGLVPTMGALHSGHAALARAAAESNDVSVAWIFVNPLQFGDATDLDRYPRTLDADVALLEDCGVDLVFAPSVEEVYPAGPPRVRITAGELGEKFEGASRPGHFDGALTVVAKLLHLCAPPAPATYRAYFGQKDAQQLVLVQRMVADLNFAVEIVPVPIVRAEDGLALSSRNRFLSPEEHDGALVLSRALRYLEARARNHEALDIDGAQAMIESAPHVQLDYLEVVDPETLAPLAENCRRVPFRGEALVLVAAAVGPVRLIDNMPLRS